MAETTFNAFQSPTKQVPNYRNPPRETTPERSSPQRWNSSPEKSIKSPLINYPGISGTCMVPPPHSNLFSTQTFQTYSSLPTEVPQNTQILTTEAAEAPLHQST